MNVPFKVAPDHERCNADKRRGETKRDEVEVVGTASARMLVTLTLLKRSKIGGTISSTFADR